MKKDLFIRVNEHNNGYSMYISYGDDVLIDEIIETKIERDEKLLELVKKLKEA